MCCLVSMVLLFSASCVSSRLLESSSRPSSFFFTMLLNWLDPILELPGLVVGVIKLLVANFSQHFAAQSKVVVVAVVF